MIKYSYLQRILINKFFCVSYKAMEKLLLIQFPPKKIKLKAGTTEKSVCRL